MTEHNMLTEVAAPRPACRQCLRQVTRRPLDERDEIHWMAPAIPLLAANRGGQHGDDGRQYGVRALPADEVHAGKSFVEEIERMASIGKVPVRDGSQHGSCEPLRSSA